MTTTMIIDPRFNGPPDCGNGGYASGLLAAQVDAPAVEVVLHRPPPLGRRLEVRRSGDHGVKLRHGGTVVATATATLLDLSVPEPVTVAEAARAAARSPASRRHPFPTCFVCGPARTDGLRIFPGPVAGRPLVAAAWTPARELANEDGTVPARFVWASLDCPGAFAATDFPATPTVLGTFAVECRRPVRVGETYVVMAWSRGGGGRKHFAGSALLSGAGVVHAAGSAIWLRPR